MLVRCPTCGRTEKANGLVDHVAKGQRSFGRGYQVPDDNRNGLNLTGIVDALYVCAQSYTDLALSRAASGNKGEVNPRLFEALEGQRSAGCFR